MIDLNYVCSESCITVNNWKKKKKERWAAVGRVGQLWGECEEAAMESTELDWWGRFIHLGI